MNRVNHSGFRISIFCMFYLTLLLMSGMHMGLLVLAETLVWSELIQTMIPLIYWAFVAVVLTVYTAYMVRKNYEKPVEELAVAADRVARGDFSVYITPLHTSDRLDYLDVMIQDFNKMVEELGSVETLKTDFFSNVSHEFKTPLAVIQNNAELLKTGISEERKKECTENILTAVRRLSSLITNMLKLNRLEKQVIHPVPSEYDLVSQLGSCFVQFESIWEKKNIEIDVDMEDCRMISADEGLLDLLWTNLLSNAFKFTPSGGKVSLKQTADDETVTVVVEDSGCGMCEEELKRIFEKFYQGDSSHATEGNGLGLALVHRIVELSQGQIQVESTPGIGSRFTVILPVKDGINGTE
ncbi:MAG: ATP-binding protein [Bulleidia sp.]